MKTLKEKQDEYYNSEKKKQSDGQAMGTFMAAIFLAIMVILVILFSGCEKDIPQCYLFEVHETRYVPGYTIPVGDTTFVDTVCNICKYQIEVIEVVNTYHNIIDTLPCGFIILKTRITTWKNH